MNLSEWAIFGTMFIPGLIVGTVGTAVTIKNSHDANKHMGHVLVQYDNGSQICEDCNPEKAFYAGLIWRHRHEHATGEKECDCTSHITAYRERHPADYPENEIIGPFTWAAHHFSVMFQGLRAALVSVWTVLVGYINTAQQARRQEKIIRSSEILTKMRGQVMLNRQAAQPEQLAPSAFWTPAPRTLDYKWIQEAEQRVLFFPLENVVQAAEQHAMREYYRYYPTEQSKTSPTQAAYTAEDARRHQAHY